MLAKVSFGTLPDTALLILELSLLINTEIDVSLCNFKLQSSLYVRVVQKNLLIGS